ncbi:hypothetical protein CONCODRAFT_78246 [Conidiobolus coronatus NRRL 28638]|uniref:Sequence orphan n=1 Tax=Conidiobolus coronatus (strain ATCC 28846 / CBS 209.66 / NRRL 28638) TaxID=796925 RepID=A0A137P9C7_CONC2|nr:hypothetical protein CONCODRAFT_78246 [Conidiobolus coronatus NRRL 28638]|eukprot:KXN71618.1 hypothetical protein CONCODRAFT_78246 [Conidiobolus coronatus NRRL 28638]
MLTNIYFTGLLLSLVSAICFDPSPIQSGENTLIMVECGGTSTSTSTSSASESDSLLLPPAQDLRLSNGYELTGGNKSSGKSKDGNIEIDLTCTSQVSTCNMVMDTFITASDYLTNIIKFTTPIKIQAVYTSFCQYGGDCDRVRQTLGKAQTTRYHPLRSDDGKSRLYPQSLVKQLSKTSLRGSLAPYDITAEFNSDANFYFQSEGGQISRGQSDFLLVVSHELVHGLGFATIYNDYITKPGSQAQAIFPNPEVSSYSDGKAKINNFYESIFDRYVVLTQNKQSLSSVTDVINGYLVDNKDRIFRSKEEAFKNFVDSSQYQVAKDLLNTAQTEGSMEFVFNTTSKTPFSSLVLETSLKPYAPSSSISHASAKNYLNTKEFLMKHEMSSGNSLSKLVSSVGSGSWDTAPYGPGLIAVLETIGYPTNQNPSPNVVLGSTSWGFKSNQVPWALLFTSFWLTYYII